MTWQEFREMELEEGDNYLYELIDGVPTKMSFESVPSSSNHPRVFQRLEEHLENFLRENPIGKYFYHAAVRFQEIDAVVPDFSYVSKEQFFKIKDDVSIVGTPDLIIEIISPGNLKQDRVEKKEIYERFGVPEFWLIDPTYQTAEIFKMKDNVYELVAFLEMEGKLTSDLLPGFEMDVNNLFKD